MNPVRTIVADDEPIARETVRAMLAEDPEIVIVAECSSGDEALAAIRASDPHLIFLDIQMPGLDGFAVLKAVEGERMPEVVFVTAYDSYALRAFAHHALDYLLKPFTDERFNEALLHAKRRIRERGLQHSAARLREFLGEYGQARRHPDRILVRSIGRMDVVPVDEIEWIESHGNYVKLHCPARVVLHRERMNDLEGRLDPREFVRIHRSAIVRISRIRSLRPLEGGEYRVILEDGRSMTLSRSYRDAVLARLGPAR